MIYLYLPFLILYNIEASKNSTGKNCSFFLEFRKTSHFILTGDMLPNIPLTGSSAMPGSRKKTVLKSNKSSVVSLPEISHGTRRTRDSYENSSHETEDRLYANIRDTAAEESIKKKRIDRAEMSKHNRMISAFNDVEKGRISQRDAAVSIEMANSTFRDAFTRWKTKGSSNTSTAGRKSFLDDVATTEMTSEIFKRSAAGGGFDTHAQFKHFLEKYWRDTLNRNGQRDWAMRQFAISDSVFYALQAKHLPELTTKADKNNRQRLLCRLNVMVPIASAALTYSVLQGLNGGLYPDDPTGAHPSLIIGEDTTTIELKPHFDTGKVRCGPGTKALMKGAGLSVKQTVGVHSRETINSDVADSSRSDKLVFDIRVKNESTDNVHHPFHCTPYKSHNKVPICTTLSGYTKGGDYTYKRGGVACDFGLTCAPDVIFKIITVKENLMKDKYEIHELSREREVYFVIKGDDINETQLQLDIDKMIVFPSAIRRRARMMDAANKMNACMSALSDMTIGSDVPESDVPESDDVLDTPRIVFCMDGKGEPLEARMQFFENPEHIPSFPDHASQLKYWHASSMLFAFNDTADFHSNLKANVINEKDIICQGDEARLPEYMSLVDKILKKHKMTPIRQRTYFQFIANFEHWVTSAASYGVLKVGCEIAGIWPFSLYQFISRFAGARSLDENDYKTIVAHFPYLVDVAYRLGYVDPQFVDAVFADFTKSLQQQTLSRQALEVLKSEELKKVKPFTEMNIKNWGAAHLNSSNVLQVRRDQLAAKEATTTARTYKLHLEKFIQIMCIVVGIMRPVNNVNATFFNRVNKMLEGLRGGARDIVNFQQMHVTTGDEELYLYIRLIAKSLAKVLKIQKKYCPKAFEAKRR